MSETNETTTTPVEAEAERAETTTDKPKRKWRSLNPEGKPTPTAGQFLYHFKLAESRQDAVDRMVNAGFHMTYNSLVRRVRDYLKNPEIDIVDKPSKRQKKSLNPNQIAADFAAEQARCEGETITESDVAEVDAPVVSKNSVG